VLAPIIDLKPEERSIFVFLYYDEIKVATEKFTVVH
jgi:hypothetical protein